MLSTNSKPVYSGGSSEGKTKKEESAETSKKNSEEKNGSVKGGSLNSSETGGHSLPGSSSADVDAMSEGSNNEETGNGNEPQEDGQANETIDSVPSSRDGVNGWETPPQESVNGMVQPRVIPPVGKPTRHTNQLDFIAKEVLKPARNHKHAWPFLKPVDAIKLNIPDYHKVIKRPMDLGTIEKRLQNVYYYSADDCLRDVGAVMTNCFLFNEEADVGVYPMGKSLEQFILNKMNKIPANEYEIPRPSQKKPGKGGGCAAATKKSAATGGANRPTLDSAAPGSIGASRESSIQRGLPDSSSSTNNAATASSSGLTTVSEVSSLAIAEPRPDPLKFRKE